MHEAILSERPWRKLEVNNIRADVLGMIRPGEVSLLYHLARSYYRGIGEIVDAGAFLGKSAISFATGLDKNRRVVSKQARIHSFDKFVADEEYLHNKIRERYDPDFRPGMSFKAIFEEAVQEYRSFLHVHEGDFSSMTWSGSPIEILFVDIAKTVALHGHLLREFFPALVPGTSVVIHQDYHHPFLSYIHVTMESLRNFFEIVDEKVDDSIVFLHTHTIPDGDLERVATYSFSADEQLNLMNAAIERLPAGKRHHVELARAVLIRKHAGDEAFRRELEVLDSKYYGIEDPHWQLYRSKF